MSFFTIALGVSTLWLAVSQVVADKSETGAGARLTASTLAGGYMIVSGEKFGQKEPEERIKGSTVRFTRDRVVVTDKDKKEVYGASYTLEPGEGQAPCKITMISKLGSNENEEAQGLIEKKGNEIRLIYALPGGQTPTEFKTTEKQLMFVMKKSGT